jgi:hypothetical protein
MRRPTEVNPTRTPETAVAADYRRRVWVTRPRPGVDRFASAWLITRFIDPDAQFAFAADPKVHPKAVPVDMFGGGFGHQGDSCTFEVLQRRFGIIDPAVRRIGEIVHDLDLKEARFRAPHAAGIGVVVEGLRAAFADDSELLRQGMILFDALYRGLEPSKSRSQRALRPQSRRKRRST